MSMSTIKECFDIIFSGNKNDSRLASRRVRKLLYGSHCARDDFKEIKDIINSAPNEYSKIVEDWRQEYFIVAVSVIYYLHDNEKNPDFFFPLLFHLLQHKNGVIRYAAVRMITNGIGPLTVHLRFPGEKSILYNELKPEEADNILYSLFTDLNILLANLWQPKYKKYKYIHSLPSSPYKSVQMVLSELEESCGQNTINRFVASMMFLHNEINSQGKT
jgi:hypothetical protein